MLSSVGLEAFEIKMDEMEHRNGNSMLLAVRSNFRCDVSIWNHYSNRKRTKCVERKK